MRLRGALLTRRVRCVTTYGIAWVAADGREVGSSGGLDDLTLARREAHSGLMHTYPRAAAAVIYQGRSLTEGVVVERIRKGG